MTADTIGYKKSLKEQQLSDNTIAAYSFGVNDYSARYGKIDAKGLAQYKNYLIDKYKPQTVNLRILGLNSYLRYIGKKRLQLKTIKVQQKTYLENVISNADYKSLIRGLKKDNDMYWYFAVRFLAATGARISEFLKIKVEHVEEGFLDLYSKGGKVRRLFIPKVLREEATQWLRETNKESGIIFTNDKGEAISERFLRYKLKEFARKYGIREKVMYPHSFRHRYAKNFIEAYNDISLLADLMGHESIDTTRIYLRRTAEEQKEIVDKVITW